ncbi:DUF2357 domain-containing protein [Paenibacillus polygoni]|uniref:DUF2357 domain-containing protein n=1 Tax=Paenibacillus polygoni TaxID=3050112 RepID=A0ABY8X421_9BACL|nr:DUF2357 domain-containing protein [Paenibacillus polygoni]WIV19783.1 DUF2357 domain-containing protein [Paenibacillus polygoni]
MIMHPKVFIGRRFNHENWRDAELTLIKYETESLFPSVEINEYQAIRIRFESESTSDRLYVDRFDSDDILILEPGSEEELVQIRDIDHMPAPGHYMVRLETTQGTYHGMYTIRGSNFDEDRLFFLRNYLEQKVSGLSYDLVTRRFGAYIDEGQSSVHILNVYRHIQENYSKLKHALESIIESPSEHIMQQYNIRSVSKKPDIKSQRWLAMKGGRNNSNLDRPEHYYERHAVLTKNVPENQWLKWFLVFLKRNLKGLENGFRKRYELQINKIDQSKSRLQQVNDSLYRYDQTTVKYGNEKVVRQLRNERDGITRTLIQQKDEIAKTKNELHKILKMVSMFSRYLEDSWLSDIKYIPVFKKPPTFVLRDQRYSVMYRLYKEIHLQMKRNSSNRESTYPYNRSSKLMEVYSTCLVIDIFNDLGFEWETGWLADHSQERFIGELLTGEKMTFVKNGYRVDLVYDQELPRRLNEDEYGFIANIHNRPDIRLDIYDKTGKLVKALVIEVKYRKYRYLWNTQFNRETDDFIQISDYNRILYRCPIERNRTSKISKVIALYPKQLNGVAFEHKHDGSVTFIQIEPVDPTTKELPFGYEYLKAEISQFINQNMLIHKNEEVGAILL